MKHSKQFLSFDDRGEMIAILDKEVKRRYGQGIYISWPSDQNTDDRFILNCTTPKFIEDRKGRERIFRYIQIKDIRTIPIKKRKGRLLVEFPDRKDVQRPLEKKHGSLITNAEKALLKGSQAKLASIDLVRIGLNPIIEIINVVVMLYNRDDYLKRKELTGKQKQYLSFLNGLDIIEMDNGGNIRPGERIDQYYLHGTRSEMSDSDRINAILGDVIERGFPYLRNERNLHHLTPILRTANIYYFNSLLKRERVRLTPEDIIKIYPRFYGRRKYRGRTKVLNYIRELSDKEILHQVGADLYTPGEEDWGKFQENMSLAI